MGEVGGHEHDSCPEPRHTYELSHTYINKVHFLPEIRLSSLHDEFSDRKSRTNLGLSTLIWEVGGGRSIVVVVCQFP